MIKYAKIINNETGLCEVGIGTNVKFYQSIGMERLDVLQSDIDGYWYLADKCPMKTEEEKEKEEAEKKASLTLTKADFWIALLDRDITKEMVKEKVALIPDEKLRAKTLIRIDDADQFWRGDPSMDIVGGMFGLTSEDLNYLFENKELPKIEESEEVTQSSDTVEGDSGIDMEDIEPLEEET